MDELALFAGAGGGLLASRLLGWRTKCAVEVNAFARSVLLARQRDGHLDRFPIWDDVKTFDGRPWTGSIDVVSGGFPCQDISAGGSRQGLSGARSGLVFEMLRIIECVRPTFVFAENSPRLRTNGLGTIVERLDRLGFDTRWCVLGARHVSGPHRRDRMWVLSTHPNRLALWNEKQRQEGRRNNLQDSGVALPSDDGKKKWRSARPNLYRMDDGVAFRMDRLRAIGNGQVPSVARLAWNILRGM